MGALAEGMTASAQCGWLHPNPEYALRGGAPADDTLGTLYARRYRFGWLQVPAAGSQLQSLCRVPTAAVRCRFGWLQVRVYARSKGEIGRGSGTGGGAGEQQTGGGGRRRRHLPRAVDGPPGVEERAQRVFSGNPRTSRPLQRFRPQ